MTKKTPLLELRELTKVFNRRKGPEIRVVDKVSLEIFNGDFIVIVGRSGTGKTTLLNLMGGLDKPTYGTVSLDGKVFGEMSNKELSLYRREKIGFVFQSFNLLPAYTVFENIEVKLVTTYLSGKERTDRINYLLDMFKLTDKADYLPQELSMGQQQKVAIVRALANNPEIILADEPTGEVDVITAREIAEEFARLNQQHNVTIIVVTHGVFPRNLGNRVVFMKGGRIVSREKSEF